MHSMNKFLAAFLLSIFLLGLFPLTAYAAVSPDVVLGNSYTLNSGETLQDNLFILGGNADLMNGSIVNGSVVLLGGNLNAAGTINGYVIVLGGTVNLASTVVLNGNLSTAGSTVNRDAGAQITGQVYSGSNAPRIFTIPGSIRLTNFGDAHPLLGVIGFFLRLFLWVLVAMVIAMIIPSHLARTSNSILSEPVTTGGLGCLTIIIAPIVIILLAITICLIPIALLAAIVLVAAWAFGLIATGFELGKRIRTLMNQAWHPVVSAGLGTLILMTVLNGVEAVIPCVGWIPKLFVGIFGLGAVLITQFGIKPYPSAPMNPTTPPTEILPPQS